jgi:twinkle protein
LTTSGNGSALSRRISRSGRRVIADPTGRNAHSPKTAVLEYLTTARNVSAEAIHAYRIGEDGRTVILPSLLPDGEVGFIKYLGIDRTPGGKKSVRVKPGCEPVLFGWQAIDPEASEVTITEGEIDAMSAWDYGRPALSVPFGVGKGDKHQWTDWVLPRRGDAFESETDTRLRTLMNELPPMTPPEMASL